MTEHFGYFDAILDSNGHYDREYNAQQWTEPFRALVTTGVMKGAYNQLEVTANGANMVSSVKSGIAFIEGRYYYNDALVELTHDTEVIGISRIDRIVVRMDTNTEARHVKTFIKKGVPSTSPVAPTLTQTPTVYEISLAQVRVNGGQTFIATNSVTDERGTNIVCPWASSKILPNFNDEALAELVQSVENLEYQKGKPYGTATLDVNGGVPLAQLKNVPLPQNATTGQAGIVKLNNTITSTSITDAATANAVKMLNDIKANADQMAELSAPLNAPHTGSIMYYKDNFGRVHLVIDVTGTANSLNIITTLPVGYRPNRNIRIGLFSLNTTGTDTTVSLVEISISSNGVLMNQQGHEGRVFGIASFRSA